MKSRKAPSIVYHYCDTNAFINIIKSKTLWLSSIKTANDYAEIRESKELLRNYFYDNKLDKYIEAFSGPLLENGFLHFLSFSEEPDNLKQWLQYADNGTGFAIGFNTNIFPKREYNIFHKLNPTKNIDCLFFDKVEYDSKKKTSIIEKLFPKDQSRYDYIQFYKNVHSIAPIFKNNGFQDEKEWRLIFDPAILANKTSLYYYPDSIKIYQERYKNDLKESKPTISEVKYRSGKFGITSYFEYPFYLKDNPIQKIIIGPKNLTQKNMIKGFLVANDYSIKDKNIIKSSITYR